MKGVTVDGLTKVFDAAKAVDDISFRAEAGVITTLLGLSGLLCYFGRFLPFAVQPLGDALRQIDPSITEAARVVGSGPGGPHDAS